MECATTFKPLKPSSNISEIVSKFAKVCRLRSIGVFYNENTNHQHQNPNNNYVSLSEDGSESTNKGIDRGGVKIHPRPVEVPGRKSNAFGGTEILKLFDVASALKLAYVQLQGAHIPYDLHKIMAANELVVAELEALCKIKRALKEKQLTIVKLESTRSDLLQAEIEVKETMLEKLKSQAKAKESEITCLRKDLQDLDVGNLILVEKIRQASVKRKNARELNVHMFEDSFKAALNSIHDFAKPLISLLRASGCDLEQAANSIEGSVVYSKKCHKKYAFEAYIARRMFHEMSLESCNVDDILRFDDPVDALIENPNSDFASFCKNKYPLVVHPMMEASFFGNLDQRMFLLSGKHPRTPLYQVFVKMAKWIWILRGIASTIDPEAKLFDVTKGCEFSDAFMEPVVETCEDSAGSGKGKATQKVEFMVMPGFSIGETLVKSRVYLSRMK
ncbi:hypothetical protein Ddye_012831 [Dipteronia dyeriana]|uniref:DUF641 domain-containing protein n=1 Tax=Dipteronia dyeriana TaxID=168575 RepID=A0AAE0CJ19_9ROSI|nr:hypothetical protein Ddye_012831 [Dipteronia dyeriana]